MTGLAIHEMPANTAVADLPQHVRDSYIPPGALDLIRRGVPENTWLAYRRQLILFGDWCSGIRRTAAPVSEATMLAYLDFLRVLPMPGSRDRRDADGRRVRFRPAPSTIWIWYSAVRFIHGIGTPPIPWEPAKKLSLAIEGYEREMRDDFGWRPRKAPRAYPDDVRDMLGKTDRDTSTGKRDAAVLLLGWHLASRASDLANYRLRDITRTPYGLDFKLTRSKTLKPGKERTTAIYRNDERTAFDPVLATNEWRDWLSLAGEADPRFALIRPLDRYGTRLRASSAGPGYFMSSTSVSGIVTKYALLAGLDETYTMHSLRRGYVTWLKEMGWDDLSIARAFGWAPGGSINVYFEDAKRSDPRAPGQGAFL